MTAPYKPAGLDRGDGQYKAPHQLVEYSPTIFDTSLDDADRDFRPSLENASPPDQQRAKAVAFDVIPIMLAKGNLAEMVRRHIEGLGLTLPRLYRLNRFARNNAIHEPTTGLAAECEAHGTTAGQWRKASRLVHHGALSILLDVPAQNRHDAMQLADLVANALDPLPKIQRRRVAKRLAGYFVAMLDGKHVLDAPKQWVMSFANDSMAPAFPAGSNALYERHKGEPLAGGYYIFHGRAGSPPVQIVRRYLGTTPTGRFVVELFKDATGKPHRAHLDPKQWHAYYRIVRHW